MPVDRSRDRTPLEQLSRREREIMEGLFALGGRASAEDIRGRLTDAPSYSAVRAMLVRLEAKGYLRHEEDGSRYIYIAKTSHTAARRAAFQRYLRVFFRGSRRELMTTLLTQEPWTDDELDALHAEIERLRKERKQ